MKYNNLSILIRPAMWNRVGNYSEKWDKKLNKILDTSPEITNVCKHTCKLDGTRVWIRNWPYGYGSPVFRAPEECSYHQEGIFNNLLPSRKTVLRLRDYLDDNYYKPEKRKLDKEIDKLLN